MHGGVGRYTANLVKALGRLGLDIIVACDKKGEGHYRNLSPSNDSNSEILLNIVHEIAPDVVHVQFDPGLYGLSFNVENSANAGTTIDKFYAQCKTPIVTTFHSGYATYRQWMNPASLIKHEGRIGRLGLPLRALKRFRKYSLNYNAFNKVIAAKIARSKESIVFSQYLARQLGNKCQIIYHGAESAIPPISKKEAREKMIISIPEKQRLALAFGFSTVGKGWDILRKIEMPEGWTLVVNSSKGDYNKEDIVLEWKNARSNVIDLERGFLTDEELSTLFFAVDAVVLPYRAATGSGVMFDALAHGLPFVATDLEFFKEFSEQGLGITARRKPFEFVAALNKLNQDYENFAERVGRFNEKLGWNSVAKEHYLLYRIRE